MAFGCHLTPAFCRYSVECGLKGIRLASGVLISLPDVAKVSSPQSSSDSVQALHYPLKKVTSPAFMSYPHGAW